jgi:hypothetical protein
MKICIFRDITPHSPLKANQRFRGTCCLHLQGWRVSKLCLLHSSCWFLDWLTLQPWSWRRYVHPKRQLTFKRLHSITSQKTDLLILMLQTCIQVFYIHILFLQTTHLILSLCVYEYNEEKMFLKTENKAVW